VTYNRLQIGILSRVKFADFWFSEDKFVLRFLVKLCRIGRLIFPSEISEFNNLQNKNFCVSSVWMIYL
jgi:hypothetical protein